MLSANVGNRFNKPIAIDLVTMSDATRNSAAVIGLGSTITIENEDIKGSRLPSSKQVLQCMFFFSSSIYFLMQIRAVKAFTFGRQFYFDIVILFSG